MLKSWQVQTQLSRLLWISLLPNGLPGFDLLDSQRPFLRRDQFEIAIHYPKGFFGIRNAKLKGIRNMWIKFRQDDINLELGLSHQAAINQLCFAGRDLFIEAHGNFLLLLAYGGSTLLLKICLGRSS